MRMAISLVALAAALATAPGTAQSPARSTPVNLAERCAALIGDYPDVVDAPTKIVGAKAVARGSVLPAHCDVRATVKPDVGVGIRLPLEGWNGKAVFVARGGFCRPVEMGECDNALRKGYACAISDYGHKTPGEQDDVWANGNVQAQVDCGFRGAHVAAVSLKAVVNRFFGVNAARAYLTGCSTGGRMALVEAQKFPYDFDGIVAGAAPVSKAGSSMTLAWGVLSLRRTDGSALLSAQDMRFVAAAALKQCDGADGLVDGVIGNALSCRVDTKRLACKPGQSTSCLMADQIAGLDKIYDGPRTPDGRRLSTGAPLPGSELSWIKAFVTVPGQKSSVETAMDALFRHTNEPVLPSDWHIADFDWSRDYKRLSLFEAYNVASNPDLSAFRDNGGKLIVYHGLGDEYIAPKSVIDWHEKVEALNGRERTAAFLRMFFLPGMGHCGGGDGPDRVDLIDAIDNWVEHGQAPSRLIATKVKEGTPRLFPLPAASVEYQRPVYAYPAETRYDGKGDPKRVESFVPTR